MSVRWPLLVVGLLVWAASVAAQGRTTITGRGSRPAGPRPSPPSPRTPLRPPLGIPAIAPPFVGTRGHRPIPFRSSTFGLFLIDPYWWAPDSGDDSGAIGPIVPLSPVRPAPTGGVQLDVEPRSALVYVDGALAGTVDRFSGYYQHLDARAGVHVVDLIAPGYDPLTVTVTVVPGQTTTYRASLNRASRDD